MYRKILYLLLGLSFSSIVPLSAHPGIGIVMDSQGNVFYTDLTHVWKITPTGEHTIAVQDVHTHELFVDEADNLYGEHIWYEGEATDKWGHFIWCLSSDGSFEKVVEDSEGFPKDNSLRRDVEGASYWSEKADDGEMLNRTSAFGKVQRHSAHKFNDIRWLHVPGRIGEVYVVDHLQLKRVTNNGEVTILSANLKEGKPLFSFVRDRHYVMGVWTDLQHRVYVALFGGKKIKRISPDGTSETIYQSKGSWSPSGGLVASDGSLWVLEFSTGNEARVKRIAPNGTEVSFKKT
ncbi:MAG: hypothetical protein HRU41_08945 [Saprospiraceae bacterium]|nr:hypothetical protein [Saprospiraceae bacterium]